MILTPTSAETVQLPGMRELQRRICAELGLSADEVVEMRLYPHCIEADVLDCVEYKGERYAHAPGSPWCRGDLPPNDEDPLCELHRQPVNGSMKTVVFTL